MNCPTTKTGLCAFITGLTLLMLLGVAPSEARDLYVAAEGAPASGSPDGSTARPWTSVKAALRSGKPSAGDRLVLAAGRHGPLMLRNVDVGGRLTIAAEPGAFVHVDRIQVTKSRAVTIRGLAVWPWPASGIVIPKRGAVVVTKASSGIRFEELEVRAVEQAPNYKTWTKKEWLTNQRGGVYLWGGADNAVLRSRIRGVRHGVIVSGVRGLVEGNHIEGFGGDGMRGLGDFGTFRGNVIQNCVKVDGNHPDGFQSWSIGPDGKPGGGVITGGIIEGNQFFNWKGGGAHPLTCRLQGVGLHTGVYRDWTIQNNLVVTSSWHGITVSGPNGVSVINNTIVNVDFEPGRRPWINMGPGRHPQLRAGQVSIVANNLANGFNMKLPAEELRYVNNMVLASPKTMLANPYAGDFSLPARSPALDAADAMLAPRTDITGAPRQPGPPDIGAFERR